MPKSPDELKEQIEKANEDAPAIPGNERTAGGLEVQPPKRSDFFSNLEKVARRQGVAESDESGHNDRG